MISTSVSDVIQAIYQFPLGRPNNTCRRALMLWLMSVLAVFNGIALKPMILPFPIDSAVFAAK